MELPDELIYDIIIKSDTNAIENLCFANTRIQQLCNNRQLWVNKFNSDGLQVFTIQTSAAQWIQEYKKVSKIAEKVDNLFVLINNELYKQNISSGRVLLQIVFHFNEDLVALLPQELSNNIKEDLKQVNIEDTYSQIIFISIEHKTYTIEYDLYDENGDDVISEHLITS